MRISSIPLAALALSLTACMGSNSNTSLDSVRQPVVEVANYSFDVEAYGGELSPSEQVRLDGWFQAINLGYGDRVAIDDRDGPVDRGVRDGLATALQKYGLLPTDHAPLTTGAPRPGTVRIVVSRSSAHVTDCPNWSQQTTTNYEGRTSPNYGCATNSNMAAMVADPMDLVRGQKSGVTDPTTATGAIQSYRRRAPGAKTTGGQ